MSNEVGPPGQKIIFLTQDCRAVWGSHRPAPRAGITRSDGLTGMFCFLFRNEGYTGAPSSVLIREAVGRTALAWGIDTFWTYIGADHVQCEIPEYCFFRARFKHDGWVESAKLGRLRRLRLGVHFVERYRDELDFAAVTLPLGGGI